MPAFLTDASCMVAALCSWHVFHGRARQEIERRLARGESMVSAGHAVIETYAVLTRLPPPHRLGPADAQALVTTSFVEGITMTGSDARTYRQLLDRMPSAGIAGGRAYDALIAACARKAGAGVLLTFNARHFEDLGGDGLTIVEPGKD